MSLNHTIKTKYFAMGLLYLSITLFTGCQNWKGTPAWVNNPKEVYPENKYLVAIGEGDSRRTAENAAAANLARIFESHIESTQSVRDTSHESNNELIQTTDFSSDINVLSAQTLFNIQHAEAWHNKSGRVYAVAYLNRQETANIYQNKIEQLTKQVQLLITQSKENENLIKQYACLRAAIKRYKETEILLQQLKVLYPPMARRISLNYSPELIQKNLVYTAKKIGVEINISGDLDNRITTIIEEIITNYGFVTGNKKTIQINGKIHVSNARPLTDDLVAVRYSLSLHIKDATGTTLFVINEKGREAHISSSEARLRALRTLETSLRTNGKKRLDDYHDSLVSPVLND